jgi:hypothetical protein
LPRSESVRRIVVSAPGYVTQSREVQPRADAELVISLKRLEGSPPRAITPAPAPPPAGTPTRRLKGPMETKL